MRNQRLRTKNTAPIVAKRIVNILQTKHVKNEPVFLPMEIKIHTLYGENLFNSFGEFIIAHCWRICNKKYTKRR